MEVVLCYFIAYIIEALILKQYCSTFFAAKRSPRAQWLSLSVAYFVLFILSFLENFSLNTAVFLFVNALLIQLIYDTRISTAMFHATILTTLMCLSELIVVAFMTHLAEDFYQSPLYFRNLLLLLLFSKQLYFWIVFAISHIFNHRSKEQHISLLEGLFLTAVPSISVYIFLTFAAICYYNPLSDMLSRMVAIGSLLLMLANLAIWALYMHINERNHEFLYLQLQLQKESDSVSYYNMMHEHSEAQNILIHDIKKHLQAIALLNEQGDTKKVAAYIDQLAISSDLQYAVRICDNDFLNAILSRYIRECREKNIEFHADIRKDTLHFLDELSLITLFGNLLDNALEAAQKQPDSMIELLVTRKRDMDVTVITLKNTCAADPFRKSDQKLISHKPDSAHHGLGLKSVARIVAQYNGQMKLYYEKNTHLFHTIITLKKERTD